MARFGGPIPYSLYKTLVYHVYIREIVYMADVRMYFCGWAGISWANLKSVHGTTVLLVFLAEWLIDRLLASDFNRLTNIKKMASPKKSKYIMKG
jgi:hypothetical protein